MVDWRLRAVNHDLLEFVQLLAQLRRRHVEFRRETSSRAQHRAPGERCEMAPCARHEMTQADWQDASLRTLGIWFGEQTVRWSISCCW